MQNGAPAGGTTNYIPAAFFEAMNIHVRKGLGMTERKTRRLPRIKPQGRERFAAADMFENRFVHSHIPRAARRRGDEESPCVGHMNIIIVSYMSLRADEVSEAISELIQQSGAEVGLAARQVATGKEILIRPDQS